MVTAATTTISRRPTTERTHPKIQSGQSSAINHAIRLIHAVCGLAGSPTLIDEIRADLRADKVTAAIRNRDTGPVFDWLMAGFRFQGISDPGGFRYIEKKGGGPRGPKKEGVCGARCSDKKR